jgi:hypothetical protein
MFDSLWAAVTPGAAVNNFFDAFSFADVGVVELAGCFRFRDELDDELTSSGLARNDEVPGMPSLAAVEFDPFAPVKLFRALDFSLSGREPLAGWLDAPPLRFENLEAGC